MESLWNQMRVQLTGTEENKAGIGATRNQKIPIQKTQSFKEKKRGQNWLQKQLSSKTSRDYDFIEMVHAAAVAAAAFSINLQETSEQKSETPEASLARSKSKVDNTKSSKSILSSASKRLSGSFRSKDDQGDKVSISSVTDEKKPEKAITAAPSMKKTSTFTGKKTDSTTLKAPPPPRPPPPPPIRKTSKKPDPLRNTTTGSNVEETNADEWERTELDKIKRRFQKLKEIIDSWEDKKRMKAKRKLIKQESELEQRRLKALVKFQNKMKYVNQVADGARAKAEENRKNEELQAKGKAGAIRTTGKLPRNYFCF
ncbi:Remorin family protein [Trifolium repens]|nr:Remorin family protein [Trifolium repens]